MTDDDNNNHVDHGQRDSVNETDANVIEGMGRSLMINPPVIAMAIPGGSSSRGWSQRGSPAAGNQPTHQSGEAPRPARPEWRMICPLAAIRIL
jgi:hypothetical protein